jgi:hypothetical protein
MNIANVKIVSGVSDYNSAITDAVKKLVKSGLRYVDFENGFSNNLDVAVRRAIITSVHQMTQEMTNFNLEKIIPNEDDRYVEVTAHFPCRPQHLHFQGKVFKLVGSTAEYPNLVEATDLGSVTGLKGANCTHDYYPYVLGASVRAYTDEQLKDMEKKSKETFSYKGQEYTPYEATQHQRKIETAMRESKRQLIALKEVGLEEDFKIASVKLQQQRKEYKQFSKVAELKQKDYRHQVEGFNSSISKQATNAAK